LDRRDIHQLASPAKLIERDLPNPYEADLAFVAQVSGRPWWRFTNS